MVSRFGLFVRALVLESMATQFGLSETSDPIIFVISDWSTPGRTKRFDKMWKESIKFPCCRPCADLNDALDAIKNFQIDILKINDGAKESAPEPMRDRQFENQPDRVELRNLIMAFATVRFEHLCALLRRMLESTLNM